MTKNKEKRIKSSFSFDGNTADYSFQLKKKASLWWLLLLLLPLVLLIPLKKDITVVTQYDGQPEPFVDVSMSYTARYLVWDKKFLAEVSCDTIQQTDSTGRTVFRDLGYSVYSFIFHHKSPVVFTACGDCFDSIAEVRRFHATREVELAMQPKLADVRLKVLDKELGFELPGAAVECEYEGKHGMQRSVDTTDAEGCVVVREARLCGGFSGIKVTADGYADTVQTDLAVELLQSEAGGHVIPLRPLKDRFTFFVKNLYTKQPVPDALAEVTLTLSGQRGTVGLSRTNVDGLGQGFYDNARVLSTIGIKASKKGYNDSTFVSPKGKPNPITVREFNTLPDSARVVWLRPKPHTVQFRNVDTLSGQPISGVRNEIVVNSIDGTTRKYEATSNRNGYFDVTAIVGDKITIKSTHDPNYHPKTTVVNKYEKAEIIYMMPKLVTLHFRTVEMIDGQVIGLLPDCGLLITVDGKTVKPDNSKSGNFDVPDLRITSTISIVASKVGYGENRVKINNRLVADLQRASQDERDIPLETPTCDAGKIHNSESMGEGMAQYCVGKGPIKFKFRYDTQHQPDSFRIYVGSIEDVRNGRARLLMELVNERSNGWKEMTLTINEGEGPYITVDSKTEEAGSVFDYVVECPD